MGVFESLLAGFKIGLQPHNLLYCFIGVFVGTLTGVLPAFGPAGALSLLLPITFYIDPVSAIIMLAGIYYGAMYGGSTTSILVNIPGETASIITCLDGYQMARQGRAGPALGMAAFASFIAGTFSIVGLMLIARPLAEFAIKFGPPEYFSLECLGLFMMTLLSRGSKLKATIAGALGLFLATIGMDPIMGTFRFTFGLVNLMNGIGIIPIAMGLFGVSEVLVNIGASVDQQVFVKKIGSLLPSFEDWMRAKWAILRGTLLGFCMGIIPGSGPIMSSFFSYALEKKVSKYPERFGTGVIEGVAGPEAANNAATGGAMVPLFSLGIPTSGAMALLFGALVIHGVQPGPLLMTHHPEVFWGAVASMYLGNGMLLVLNLPLIGIWVRILKVPYRLLFPILLLFTLLGTFAVDNKIADIFFMVLFGIVGYFFRRFGYEGAPLLMGYVLGSLMEKSLRQSLIMSDGSFLIFLRRPISAVLLAGLFILVIASILPSRQKRGARKND
jgi:putative tricarboxylic transport membrane protein